MPSVDKNCGFWKFTVTGIQNAYFSHKWWLGLRLTRKSIFKNKNATCNMERSRNHQYLYLNQTGYISNLSECWYLNLLRSSPVFSFQCERKTGSNLSAVFPTCLTPFFLNCDAAPPSCFHWAPDRCPSVHLETFREYPCLAHGTLLLRDLGRGDRAQAVWTTKCQC